MNRAESGSNWLEGHIYARIPLVEELITLDIPAKAEYVVLGRLALAGLLRDRGFSDDAVADLKLALTEACSNSVRHAYADGEGQVHLSFTVCHDRVVVAIRDEGEGFQEDDELFDSFTTESGVTLSEGGMGMAIIRSVVDGFDLQRPTEGGTTLTLIKLRDA